MDIAFLLTTRYIVLTVLKKGTHMNAYRLTVTVAFQEADDPAARKRARAMVAEMEEIVPQAEVKLQQVFADQPPRGIPVGS